jgi:hypothetical protein
MVVCRFQFSCCEKKVFDKDKQMFVCSGNPCYPVEPVIKQSSCSYLSNVKQSQLNV